MLKLALFLVGFAATLGRAAEPRGFFVHPGLLHSREDLARMKQAVADRREPQQGSFEKLRAHPASQSTYVSQGAAEEIGRNPGTNHPQFDADANAAYQCALMWCLTGNRAFAETAQGIINAWSARLQRVTGADAVLMAGLGPFKLINAAELLRHTDAGWTEAEAAQTEEMLRRAIVPVLKDFAPFANGNWDTAAIKTLLAIGVFCEDRPLFERALRYTIDGAGNGRLTHYIINDAGQCQESGRDMPHTQLGLGHLGDAAEIAWQQGLDLYGYADNRLLHGFEYTARYNLGETVPFAETLDRTGKYHHKRISSQGRGALRPVFEQIYHHYVNRAGLAAPWTQQAAEKLRPEGHARPGADHPGFGTLLYSREPVRAVNPLERATPPPRAPAGLTARGTASGNTLAWVPAIGAVSYTVKRTQPPAQSFTVLASHIAVASFTDSSVEPGGLYAYSVTAHHAHGESSDAFPVSIVAGLPTPWRAADIGTPASVGRTNHDGEAFTLEAGGIDIGGRSDQFHFAHRMLMGDGVILARFVPHVSSQLSKFGVMIRQSLAADSPHAALFFVSDPARERERPTWNAHLVTRTTPGEQTRNIATHEPLRAPHVTYGRLMEPYWLRLARRGDVLTGALSPDGREWVEVGTIRMSLGREVAVGLAACSRLATVTTSVRFDQVSVTGDAGAR